MGQPPSKPKIYHITPVENLLKIVEAGGIWSDAKRIELGIGAHVIGMSQIKQRRLEELEVKCYPGTKVGEYVPFYYCPRSIMLYILHRGNHESIDYTGGQGPIVHLQADLHRSIRWAEKNSRWAASPTNAGARYTDFFHDVGEFSKIDWEAVGNRDFRSPSVKEGKQAEFLVYEKFPWTLVEHIGVFDEDIKVLAEQAVQAGSHDLPVRIENSWYF